MQLPISHVKGMLLKSIAAKINPLIVRLIPGVREKVGNGFVKKTKLACQTDFFCPKKAFEWNLLIICVSGTVIRLS